jgi:hypothetical protein
MLPGPPNPILVICHIPSLHQAGDRVETQYFASRYVIGRASQDAHTAADLDAWRLIGGHRSGCTDPPLSQALGD